MSDTLTEAESGKPEVAAVDGVDVGGVGGEMHSPDYRRDSRAEMLQALAAGAADAPRAARRRDARR